MVDVSSSAFVDDTAPKPAHVTPSVEYCHVPLPAFDVIATPLDPPSTSAYPAAVRSALTAVPDDVVFSFVPVSVTVAPSVIVGAELTAALIESAPISHCVELVKLPDIVTVVVPGSDVDPPTITPLDCHHCSVWPPPGAPPDGAPCQYCTSITMSPTALAASIVASVPVPVADTNVPAGVVWLTPLNVLAPPAAAVVAPKLATTLAVPSAGDSSTQISTAWLPAPRPTCVKATPPYVTLVTDAPRLSMASSTKSARLLPASTVCDHVRLVAPVVCADDTVPFDVTASTSTQASCVASAGSTDDSTVPVAYSRFQSPPRDA